MRVIDGDGDKLKAEMEQEFLRMVTAPSEEESEQAKQRVLDLSRRRERRGSLTAVTQPAPSSDDNAE